jgi:hypothetical protein
VASPGTIPERGRRKAWTCRDASICQDRLRPFLLSCVVDGCAHLLCGVVTCNVRAVRLCAGCAGGGHRGGEGAVELAGDIALDAAADLAVAFAIGTATGDVGLGGGVGADPRVGDDVDRLVQRPVADPVKSVAGGLVAGGLDRAGPASLANAASLRQRPAWENDTMAWAALTGPIPAGWSARGSSR